MLRIACIYLGLSLLPGCPNGSWSSKYFYLKKHSPLCLFNSFILFCVWIWHFIHFLIWTPTSIKFGILFFLFLEAFHRKNHTYRHISEGKNMDSLCCGCSKKTGTSLISDTIFQWEEYSWYFKNDAFRNWFSRFHQLATPS